jgi:hypothetical protein
LEKEVERLLVSLLVKGYIVGFETKPEGNKIRVLVKSKDDVRALNLPMTYMGYDIEYVEAGEIKLLSGVPNRQKFRPVRPGASIGIHGYGTGTLTGVFRDGKGNIYLASNAHVMTVDPTRCPWETPRYEIIQPGPHDGGTRLDVIGYYKWHQPIVTLENPVSCCPISRIIAYMINRISEALGRRTRFRAEQAPINYVDFAVATPVVDYDVTPVGLENHNIKMVGVGFAGSDLVSALVNIYNVMQLGYTPVGLDVSPVKRGSTVVKTGRTTGVTAGSVILESAVITVNIGAGTAIFADVIVTTKMLEPGDSGSPVFVEV